MEIEETEICAYLKGLHNQFISGREIARRAGGKRRYRENQGWAVPYLAKLVEKNVLESDSTGHYRLIIKEVEKDPKKKWLSPKMKNILQNSDKNFTHIIEDEDLPDGTSF